MSEKPAPPQTPHRPPSRRFDPTIWSARLAPALMVFLALALLLSIAIVILSVLGLMPGF